MPRIPRYLSISKAISDAIGDGRLQAGMVLLEEPLARHFDASRTTIRNALTVLFEQKEISRFNGRGFLVGADPDTTPNRAAIEPLLFNAETAKPAPRSISNPDQILPALRQALVRALPFGPFRISEAELGDAYDVSRTVIRETLSQLRSSGLVRKSDRSNWVLGPLTAQEVRNHYELRILLEPVALQQSAASLSGPELVQARQRLLELGAAPFGDNAGSLLGQVEEDLHYRLLAGCRNGQLLTVLRASSLVLAINEMFRTVVGHSQDNEILVAEHLAVIDALQNGAVEQATDALRYHLECARERTCRRLKTLSVLKSPPVPDYLTPEPISINQAISA